MSCPGRRALIPALAVAVLGAAGCAVPPWSMGAPLDGKPSIPPTTEAPSTPRLRATARAERLAGHAALELRSLLAISAADRLAADERGRLVLLLEERALELLAQGRAVAACADLRLLEERAPARARALTALRAAAERDAGDAWLAVGDRRRARESYETARTLGASATDFRLAAAAESLPSHLDAGVAERAVLSLPLRAVPAFAELYLASVPAAAGADVDGTRRAALARALQAAQQEKKRPLAARLGAMLSRAGGAPPALAPGSGSSPAGGTPAAGSGEARSDVATLADALLDAPAAPIAPRPPAGGAADSSGSGSLFDWSVGSPSVSFRLLPLLRQSLREAPRAAAVPSLSLFLGDRARAWADLLLEEDPTSTDVLEIGAVVDAFAGRTGGAERKLIDLVYFSPDRYDGLVRSASIWERVGQGRLACVAWVRAARWRDEFDDPAWGPAIACTHADAGAGDWRAVLAYVLARAPAERRAALARALDPTAAPAPAAEPAGDPIPCDTAGRAR